MGLEYFTRAAVLGLALLVAPTARGDNDFLARCSANAEYSYSKWSKSDWKYRADAYNGFVTISPTGVYTLMTVRTDKKGDTLVSFLAQDDSSNNSDAICFTSGIPFSISHTYQVLSTKKTRTGIARCRPDFKFEHAYRACLQLEDKHPFMVKIKTSKPKATLQFAVNRSYVH